MSEAADPLRRHSEARSYLDFQEFIARHNGPGKPRPLLDYEHVPTLARVFQHVADTFKTDDDGEPLWRWTPGLLGSDGRPAPNYKRVIVLLPTRYFKSEIASRLFPAYFVSRYPEHSVLVCSYGADLAWELTGEARAYYEAEHGRIMQRARAQKRWQSTRGGGVWGAGAGGPLLGHGFNVGIIDDPIKPGDIDSTTHQRKFERWYPSTFLSRQEPGAAIVVIMQRLGAWDPIAFLLDREVTVEPEHWHLVILDEIHSLEPYAGYNGPMGLPSTCTLEADDRALEQLLAPSRFSPDEARKLQATAGPQVASAQRQQRPLSLSGDYWQAEWFYGPDNAFLYDALPENAYNGGRDWDTAYTEDPRNAASAYIESYRGPGRSDEFLVYLEDLDWDWLTTPMLVWWMGGPLAEGVSPPEGLVQLPAPHYVEARASGKSIVPTLHQNKIPAKEVEVPASKLARSNAVQPFVSSGRLRVNRRVVKRLLEGDVQGLLRITVERLLAGGAGLDLNDAFTQALARHLSTPDRWFVA